jgi:hypothetical protein
MDRNAAMRREALFQSLINWFKKSDPVSAIKNWFKKEQPTEAEAKAVAQKTKQSFGD